MSAWMTTKVHRSALVQAAVINGIIEPQQASSLFSEMTRSNRLALHYRYGDKHPDQFEEETREVVEAPLDPHVLILNIGCWQYQCSEYDEFHKQWDNRIMDALRNHLQACLGYAQDDEGYEDWSADHQRNRTPDERLPWGIDEWHQVVDTRTP